MPSCPPALLLYRLLTVPADERCLGAQQQQQRKQHVLTELCEQSENHIRCLNEHQGLDASLALHAFVPLVVIGCDHPASMPCDYDLSPDNVTWGQARLQTVLLRRAHEQSPLFLFFLLPACRPWQHAG